MIWDPAPSRISSVKRAIRKKEFLVAETRFHVVGFIHYVIHEDVVDGAPNAFITAFYVKGEHRRKGIGTGLLHEAVSSAASRGATFVETSTIHSNARAFYENHGFKQSKGEIGEVFLELDVKKFMEAK